MLSAECFPQIRHLHRRQRRLESLVAHFQSGAINRLLQRFAGEHAKGMWHSSLLRRLADPSRDFVDDHVVMGSVATKQAAETDDGVVSPSFGKGARGRG